MKAVMCMAACGLVAVSAGRALAQSPSSPSSESAAEAPPLEEVVVTAKGIEPELPQQLAQYGTRVDTVSAAQIQNGGYIDVAQALQATVPGIYIASSNGPFNYVNVSLQGSRTEDVLWLVDGIRINNRLYAGTTPLDTVPAGMIERIEVLDGAQALFYGTQAVAGAVNIVTKSFTDHPDGAVSVGADTNNGKHVNGYFRDAIANNDFVVFATHDESHGISPFPAADYQPSGTERRRGYDVTALGAKYAYDFTDQLALSASYQHTDGRLDLPSAAVVAIAHNDRHEDLLSSKLDYVPSDAFKFYIKDYYHRWSSYYTEYDNGSTPYIYTPGEPGELTMVNNGNYWGYKDYGINLMTQLAVNRGFEYFAGYDFQNYTGQDSVLVIQRDTERVNALFAQVRTTPELLAGAHLAAGLRYNMPSFGPSALVWNVGGQYDLPASPLFVRANVGTAFRLPTAEELFADDPQDERGDPNLKPETSVNANLSVGGSAVAAAPLHWELIGFFRRIRNLIDYASFDDATGQDVFGNVTGDVVVRGLELTLAAPVTASLSGTFSATYSHSREAGSNVQFDRIPLTQFKVGLDYHPQDSRFGGSLTLVRLGDLDDEPLGSGNGRVGYGDYTVVDLGGRIFLDEAHHHRLDLHLNNLFNREYYSGLGHAETDDTQTPYVTHYLAPPRTFEANYTFSF